MHQGICHGIYSKFSCKFLVLDYLCNGLHYFSFPVSFLVFRDGSRTAATSKMERFVIIVNGFHLLIIITKCSIMDVAAVLDLLLGFNTSELDKSLRLEKEFQPTIENNYKVNNNESGGKVTRQIYVKHFE